MNRPYDYINEKIIDVNNPIHQKIVIQRNKKLANAKTNGMLIADEVKVSIKVAFECPNCGTQITKQNTQLDTEEIFKDVYENLPKEIECHCCKATFGIYKDSYHISLPKPILK